MRSITPERVKVFMNMVKNVIEANPGKPVSISSIYKALYITSSIQAAIRKAGYIDLVSHQGNQGGIYSWKGGEVTDDMVAKVIGIYTSTRTRQINERNELAAAEDTSSKEVPEGADAVDKEVFSRLDKIEQCLASMEVADMNTAVHQTQARVEYIENTINVMYGMLKELYADLKGVPNA